MDEKLLKQIAFLDSQIELREAEIEKVDACADELEALKAELEELKAKVEAKEAEFDSVKESKDKFAADIEVLRGIKESLFPEEPKDEEAIEAVEEPAPVVEEAL